MRRPDQPVPGDLPREGRKRQSKRARWGTISRQQIIDTAMRVVERGAFEQMTIRSLSAELGVAPMSLYRHVRDKDDILDEVVDRLLAPAWEPQADVHDWWVWISEAADRLRHLLATQPAALHVYVRHPVVSSAAISRMEAMMDVLRGAGFDEQAARSAYAAIHTYTVGFAALEASRADWAPEDDAIDPMAHQLAAYTTPDQFADGLKYLLEGIEHHAGNITKGPGAGLPPPAGRRC